MNSDQLYNKYKRDPESTKFYKSAAWRKKRVYILKRDKYLCQICKRYGRNKEAEIVHHIEELLDKPELRLKNSNLVSVCRVCHNMIHKKNVDNDEKKKKMNMYAFNRNR